MIVSDYWPDIKSGRAVNAKLVIGVLTGLMSEEQLLRCGVDLVLNSVAGLLDVLSNYFVDEFSQNSF